MNPIMVTGATGNVGAEIVRLLVEQGYPARAAMRDVQGAEERFGEGTDLIDYVSFNFGRPETYEAAFRGVKAMFLMRPPAVADASKLNAAVDAAKVAGVQHVVFLSLQGVEKNPVVPHAKTEKYLKSSGLTYTFLRASFFMQNLDTTHRKDIAEYGEIFVPAGRGKTSFIDVRDIAAVAVKALTEEGHENRAYELTGADALDYFQVADIFTDVLGKEVTYPNPSPWRFWRRMRKRGLEVPFILVMIGLYTACRFGLASNVTRNTAQLLGRRPISVRQYVEDYKESWLL